MNEGLQQLADLGYRVELSQEGGERYVGDAGETVEPDAPNAQRVELPDSYFVEGFGFSGYVHEDDAEALAQLTDAEAHEGRVFQFEQPEAAQAQAALSMAGFEVERDGDEFRIDGEELPKVRKVNAADLPALAGKLLGGG